MNHLAIFNPVTADILPYIATIILVVIWVKVLIPLIQNEFERNPYKYQVYTKIVILVFLNLCIIHMTNQLADRAKYYYHDQQGVLIMPTPKNRSCPGGKNSLCAVQNSTSTPMDTTRTRHS